MTMNDGCLVRSGRAGEGVPERSEGERSEPERSAGTPSPARASTPAATEKEHPDPEVLAKASRRRFTGAYKLRIVRAADACPAPGQVGALLRREGLYSSHLTAWRQLRDRGALQALHARRRGRKVVKPDPLARRVAELARVNQGLEHRLQQAQTIIEFQKKVSELLGIPLTNPGRSERV